MPCLTEFPIPLTDGGGATTEVCPIPRRDFIVAQIELCACIGICGAGAKTCKWPMLISPISRTDWCTEGGGSITEVRRAVMVRGLDNAETSGGGAITATGPAGTLSCLRVVAESGTAGDTEFQETRRSSRKSCFSLISGGVISACMRLCRSRGTEMTGRLALTGNSLFHIREGGATLPGGGEYSEGK